MGLFDRLFGGSSNTEPQPDISFGRYSDSYKEAEQYDSWDSSLDKFDEGKYLDAYLDFFRYLADEQEKNVTYRKENGGIHFEVLQGSKRIVGFADHKKVKAEAKVAVAENLNLGFMRRLMEANFSLKYSRFALDEDNNITIKFDTYTLDGSPYKLYYAIKEVATHADKQDDLLLDEFKMLNAVETSHLIELPEVEKMVKYTFIQNEIKKVFNVINSGELNASQYPGGISYLLLNLCYKLDYLIKPEGYMMEQLEKIHRIYFNKEEGTTGKKNVLLQKEFDKLLNRPKEDYFKEMYRVKATFGITSTVNHDRLVEFIDGELHNMDWYQEQKHLEVSQAIPGYIAGYFMFAYAVPKPDREYLHLYFQITESKYFLDLGFKLDYYNPDTKTFNRKSIKRMIKDIAENNEKQFPELDPNTNMLKYSSLLDFSRSYLLMIRNLDMTKKE